MTETIVVRRQWNDWRKATYKISDVEGAHWSEISGGVQASSLRPFLHAYVMCDAMLDGELSHSCVHGKGPHQIKVCITKVDNTPTAYATILATASKALK